MTPVFPLASIDLYLQIFTVYKYTMGPSLLLWTRTIDHYGWCKRKRNNDDGRENGEYSLILLLSLSRILSQIGCFFLGTNDSKDLGIICKA